MLVELIFTMQKMTVRNIIIVLQDGIKEITFWLFFLNQKIKNPI